MIPRLEGVVLSQEWKEAPLDNVVTGEPRPCAPSEQQYSNRELHSRNWVGSSEPTPKRWCKRARVEDMNAGLSEPRSTALDEAEKAAIVALWQHTPLLRDDCRRAPAEPQNQLYPAHALQNVLRSQRHRAPVDQAQPSLKQRSCRANEQHDQGRDRHALHHDSHAQLRMHIFDFMGDTTSPATSRHPSASRPKNTCAKSRHQGRRHSSSTRSTWWRN